MTSSTVRSTTEGFDVDSGETTMSDMDEMTTTIQVVGGKSGMVSNISSGKFKCFWTQYEFTSQNNLFAEGT